MAGFDTIIIGGGVIGCSLARLLAHGGMRVAVIDRGAPGQEASWAAAGMLSPSAEAEHQSPLCQLARASFLKYRPLVEELKSETGIDPQYRTEGTLLVHARNSEREQSLPSVELQRAMGIAVAELSPAELRQREPQLASVAGAFYLPEDHQIDNRLLMQALIQSCRQRGVEFLLGKPALEVARNGRRVAGVVMKDGAGATTLGANHIVNTAGAWASDVSVSGVPRVAIRPVKGHIVALDSSPDTLRHVIRSHSGYLVPRHGGRILVGSTMEEAGFDKAPRAAALTGLLTSAQQLCPALENSVVVDFWAGLRPASSDGLPVLGPTDLEGYWLALGHFRNGILLAPITARILSSWLLTGKPSMSVDAFRPQRFAD